MAGLYFEDTLGPDALPKEGWSGDSTAPPDPDVPPAAIPDATSNDWAPFGVPGA
jgi:hypothetical protein